MERKLLIKKTDNELQIAWAEVYVPLSADTQEDFMTAEEIRKSMIMFAKNGYWDHVDLNHSCQKSGAVVVDQFQAGENDPNFKAGSWVVGIWFPDDIWPQVKAGTYNGLSLYSDSFVEIPVTLPVKQIKQLSGSTEENIDGVFPKHKHDADLFFEDGQIVPTFTKESFNHPHYVRAATATEEEAGHSHILKY
jgi:hypothetical protein